MASAVLLLNSLVAVKGLSVFTELCRHISRGCADWSKIGKLVISISEALRPFYSVTIPEARFLRRENLIYPERVPTQTPMYVEICVNMGHHSLQLLR